MNKLVLMPNRPARTPFASASRPDLVVASSPNQFASRRDPASELRNDRFPIAGRFQFRPNIINAFSPAIGFDGGVDRLSRNLTILPACLDGRFGGLIMLQNQHGADL
jgi:hypothetical protein